MNLKARVMTRITQWLQPRLEREMAKVAGHLVSLDPPEPEPEPPPPEPPPPRPIWADDDADSLREYLGPW